MNRVMTIMFDTHADDYNSQHGKTCSMNIVGEFHLATLIKFRMMKVFYHFPVLILSTALLATMILMSCEPDDLSKPVRVHFELHFSESAEDATLPYLTFRKIIIDIEKIGFYGIRQEGDDVLFNTRPGDSFGLHILTPAQNSSYVTYFDLKQGVYQLMRWEIELGEIDDEIYPDDLIDTDDFGFIIEGSYTRLDGTTVLLFIAIEEEEIISMETVDQEGKVPIPIVIDNVYTVCLVINPYTLMKGIPRSMLEQAETDEEDDIEFIEISEDENEELFNLVLFQLSKTLKAIVK